MLNNICGLLIGLRILCNHNFGILFTKILNHDWLNYHIVDEDNLFACLLISDYLDNSFGLASIINIVDVFIVRVCCLDNNWLSCGNINLVDWRVASIISWKRIRKDVSDNIGNVASRLGVGDWASSINTTSLYLGQGGFEFVRLSLSDHEGSSS